MTLDAWLHLACGAIGAAFLVHAYRMRGKG